MTSTQIIEYNGHSYSMEPNQTIADFLLTHNIQGRFIVVLNNELIPKSTWSENLMTDGDKLDIISPISGG